jgi:colicin import membrane protein
VETETVTALVTIEHMTAVQLFAPGALNPILERIKAEARAAAAESDISTEAGRKAVASLAYKVARTKTYIDEKRVELVADRKKEIAAIDTEGRRFRDEMDALKEEVRAPLTEWESADKARVEEHERRIRLIGELGAENHVSIALVDHALTQIDGLWDHNFQEFTKRASRAREIALIHLNAERTSILQEIAAKVERERLRIEAEEKARVEREAKIAEDARLKAEAEAKRREEAQALAAKQREDELARVAAEEKGRLERERKESEARLQKSLDDARAKAQRDKLAAQERERIAEIDRKAAAAKAEADRIAAERLAELDRHAAVVAERKRQESIRAAEEAQRDAIAREKVRREADETHRYEVHSLAVSRLISHGFEEREARRAINVIADGHIPGVSITY